MVGELVMLPLRIGVRATRMWFRVAEETANVAVSATGRLIAVAASRGSDGRGPTAAATRPPEHRGPREVDSRDQGSANTSVIEREPASSAPPPAARAASPATPASELAAPPEPEPPHVSEEPTLVEEFAEPGAEEGAGAEIHVQEPWDGYGRMNAKQVITRINTATPAELAAVQLYESSNRRRQTILNAVQREFRTRNGSGSSNQ